MARTLISCVLLTCVLSLPALAQNPTVEYGDPNEVHASGQDKASKNMMWPSLGRDKRLTTEGDRPLFTINLEKLKRSKNQSGTRYLTGGCHPSESCLINVRDFFAQWSHQPGIEKSIEKSVLRLGVMMHHYPDVWVNGHNRGTGTYVFFLPKQEVFYLWGDCYVNHLDIVVGPFAGDPRVVLKKLAESASAN